METQCVGSKLRKKCHESLRVFHRSPALSIRIYAVLYTVEGECTQGIAIGVEMERVVHKSVEGLFGCVAKMTGSCVSKSP